MTWDASVDPENDPLTYMWQLDTSSDFSDPLMNEPGDDGGSATRFETDYGTLAATLDAEGVPLGDSLSLFHRVVASDGANEVEGDATSLVLTRGTVVGTEPGAEVPQVFALHANYPNPFNPATMFSFDLPKPSDVRLTVYDALGREVETVVSGPLPAGTFEYTWEAHHLPSGLYVYRLEAGIHRMARMLILAK